MGAGESDCACTTVVVETTSLFNFLFLIVDITDQVVDDDSSCERWWKEGTERESAFGHAL